MSYAQLFSKLEKKNPQKAYWLDLCRRDNISLFDFPTWIGMIIFASGMFAYKVYPILSKLMIWTGLGLFFVAMIACAAIHYIYTDKLERESGKAR